MPCSYCNAEKKIVARGLCNACYQRQRSNGSLARKIMSNVGRTCSYEGCSEAAVAKGFCHHHYGYNRHPLTNTWHLLCSRHCFDIPDEWHASFEKFLADVGERPEPKSQLRRIEEGRPWSATNVRWLKPVHSHTYPPEKLRAYQTDWRLRRKFGLEVSDYQAMLEAQNGRCAICNGVQDINKKTGEPRYLGVDHCHKTNKVRGLLCVNCNRGLGYFDDNIDRLKSAIAYLKKHAST